MATYLVYTALLNQSGTGDPVATVMENTLDADPVWTRQSAGVYWATLAGAFLTDKVFLLPRIVTELTTDPDYNEILLFRLDDNTIQILTGTGPHSGRTSTDGMLTDFPIEIRVYP